MQLGTFVLTIFFLPETLYARNTPDHKERTFLDSLLFRSLLPSRSLRLTDFASPLLMLRYLCITIPGLYYMTAFGYGSVMFANTGSQFFREFYGFTTAQTGLMLSIPLLIGCLIGEASTGWFTDWLVFQDAKKHGGVRRPEARLNALWLGLCVPIGVIIDGICLTRFKTVPWIGSAVGMGIASFGLQAATTVTYTYCTDVSQPLFLSVSALQSSAKVVSVLQTAIRPDLRSAQPFPLDLLGLHIILCVSVLALPSSFTPTDLVTEHRSRAV